MEANTVINQTDALDFAIAVVVILFVLSIMTEKFTELVRKYPRIFTILLLMAGVFCIGRVIHLNYFKCEYFECLNITGSYTLKYEKSATRWIVSIWNGLLVLILLIFLICAYHSRSPINYWKGKHNPILLSVFLILGISGMFINKGIAYVFTGCILIAITLIDILKLPAFVNFGRWSFTLNFFSRIHNTSTIDDSEEKKAEITILALIVGLIIAYLFNADFFNLIKAIAQGAEDGTTQPLPRIGWEEATFPFEYDGLYYRFETSDFEPITFIGLLLTGFFLSFGSQFFHDLLDRLYYAKRAKEQELGKFMSNPTKKATGAPIFEELMEDKQIELIKLAQVKEDWKAKYPNITGTSIGFKKQNEEEINQYCLIFKVAEKVEYVSKDLTLPKTIKIKGYDVPTDIQVFQIARAQNSPKPKYLDYCVSRLNTKTFGTISFKFKYNRQWYAIGCFHVLFHNETQSIPKYLTQGFKNPNLIIPSYKHGGTARNIIGEIIGGEFTNSIDLALIKLYNGRHLNVKELDIIGSRHNHTLRVSTQEVISYGCMTRSRGKIDGIEDTIDITFDQDNSSSLIEMKSLIRCSRLSIGGDSGALVETSNNEILGIIVAGDQSSNCSYILPITQIRKSRILNIII